MTRENFIERLTKSETRWDLTIESDYMNGVLMAATVTSTDPDQITITTNRGDSMTLDISESEINVIDEDYKYSFIVAGITFVICESIF